jgi:hypothetical protein
MAASMKFDLLKPCADCPFRRDTQKGWLGKPRAEEIADALLRDDKTFACHKTVHHHDEEFDSVDADERRVEEENRQHCAGAIALVDAVGAPNAMLQIAERLGLRNPDRVTDEGRALSFDSESDFIAAHTNQRRK